MATKYENNVMVGLGSLVDRKFIFDIFGNFFGQQTSHSPALPPSEPSWQKQVSNKLASQAKTNRRNHGRAVRKNRGVDMPYLSPDSSSDQSSGGGGPTVIRQSTHCCGEPRE